MGIGSIGELFIDLGFDVDPAKLKDFDAGIQSVEHHLLSLTAVATGSVIGLDVFVSKVADRATAMRQFGEQTGYSVQKLQEWALVINRTNPLVGLDAAKDKYKSFADYVTNINWGAGGGAILSQLGVDYFKGADPSQYLEQLSQKLPAFIAQFGRARAGMLLDQVGIGAGSIDALLTSAAQRHSMTDGLINSDAEIANIDRINQHIAALTQRWEKFESDLLDRWADPLIGQMNRVEAAMERWLPEIDKVAQALGGWQVVGEGVLTYFAGRWLIGMLGAIAKVGTAFLGLGSGVLGGVGAFVAAPAVGVGAAVGLDKLTGYGQWIADIVAPIPSLDQLRPKSAATIMRDTTPGPRPGDKDVTVTNSLTQHIHSTAEPGAVGRQAASMWDDWFQKQLDATSAGINLGVRY